MRAAPFILLICFGTISFSQIVFDEGKAPAKHRSPELEALNWMLGKWTSEFVVRETPESKQFKANGISVAQWSPNGQFLISDEWSWFPGSGAMPNFWKNKLSITTWDSIKKEYRVTEVTADSTSTMTMTLGRTGDCMIYSEDRKGDHVTKTTITLKHISDSEISIRSECSIDDGPRWTFIEGTGKRVSADLTKR